MVKTGYDAQRQAEMNVHHILREQGRQSAAIEAGRSRRRESGQGIYILGVLQSLAVSVYFLNDKFDGFGLISTLCILGLSALFYVFFHVPIIGGFLRLGFSVIYGYLAGKLVLYFMEAAPNSVSVFGYDIVTTWQAWLAGVLIGFMSFGWQLMMFGIDEESAPA